jgi:hypothetical protein
VTTVAVVGAGVAGVAAARGLAARGLAVTLLDKSPRAGGRMATRRLEVPGVGTATFDHGCQRWVEGGPADDRFRAALLGGVPRLTAWSADPAGTTSYRSAAGMRAVVERLAAAVPPLLGVRVEAAHRTAAGWHLRTADRGYEADWLVLTPPLPQALDLLGDGVPVPAGLRGIAYSRCVTLLAAGRGWSRLPPEGGVWPDAEPLAAVVDNHAKGVSAVGPAVTIQAAPDASLTLWDRPDAVVVSQLLEWASGWVGFESPATHVHRWRFNRPLATWPEPCYADHSNRLVLAGDAFGGPGIDGAYRSGLAAAEAIR